MTRVVYLEGGRGERDAVVRALAPIDVAVEVVHDEVALDAHLEQADVLVVDRDRGGLHDLLHHPGMGPVVVLAPGLSTVEATRLLAEGAFDVVRGPRDDLGFVVTRAALVGGRLRESRRRYVDFVENSAEGVYYLSFEPPIPTSLDPDEQVAQVFRNGRYVECNDAFARAYGYTREALLGRGLDTMWNPEDPDSRAFMRSILENGYRADDVESEERDHAGRTVHFENSIVGVVRDGHLLGAWGVQREVTARKEAEAALRESEERLVLAVEGASLGTWDCNLSTRNIVWNAECHATFGFAPGTFAGTMEAFYALVHPDDRARLEKALEGAIKSRLSYETTFRIVRPDGNVRWLVARGRAIHDAGGRPVRMLGVVADVTKQVELQEERDRSLERERAARSEAERLNRLKDEFLATLSHELRTPLNAILGWAQLVQEGSVRGEAIHRAMSVITRNAKAQARLVGDLLDMSRIVRGEVRLELRPTPIRDVVDAALETARPSAKAKSLSLEANVAPDAGSVTADPQRLQQVVWNLVSNALKFTPSGGRVRLDARREGDEVVLTVSDDGDGIDGGFLPFVFDRFRQGDGSITRAHGGLGLGLAIVRNLVELHGGRVSAASDGPGHGATFTVRLPRAV